VVFLESLFVMSGDFFYFVAAFGCKSDIGFRFLLLKTLLFCVFIILLLRIFALESDESNCFYGLVK
jgi:hypothetical protein